MESRLTSQIVRYEQLGHPIPMFNGAGQQSLPVPAPFVVASDGIVLGSAVVSHIGSRRMVINHLLTLGT